MIGGSQVAFQFGPFIGYGLGILAALGLLWASLAFGSPDSRFNIVLLISGGLIGWLIGILMTPGPSEKERFTAYGVALATFASGYLVAKIDRLIELSFQQREDIDAGVIGRLLLFVSGLALGLLFTFVWRSYVSPV